MINKDIKIEIESKLLDEILINVIFQHQKKNEQIDLKNHNAEYINLESLEKGKNEKFSNRKFTEGCYKLVGVLMYNSMDNIDKYFEFTKESEKTNQSVNNVDSKKERNEGKRESKSEIKKYKKFDSDEIFVNKEGYVGLKNLGCICYMNAMLQQFFMVPTLRFSLMQVKDNILSNYENQERIDDNVLHQVQEMFSYLTISKRESFNMKGFCHAFKGIDVSII